MTEPAGLASALADRYHIQRELGHGGMATVYLAHDLRHDRPVAIKVLRPELTAILGAERFGREINITSKLDHPNILPLLDSGETSITTADPLTPHASRLLYYVMPYVQGETLRDLLKRETQLPIDQALALFGEIADALDYAHRQGFVHRDLKPENILLQDGHARVADFGIARSMSAVASEKLTETGLALGTPQYMSPEQAAGQGNIDARSDIYALGCLLYEMLAGNPPFQGPTVHAIMARHALDPVPTLRTVRATVPPPVEAAITKALAKVPADRFTTAAQFVEAFSKPVPTLPSAGTKRRPAIWIAGVIVVTTVGGALLVRSRQPQVTPSASVIAVLPFGTSGDTALARLGRDLVLTVSQALDGVGGIRTADPQMVLSRADDSRSGQYLPNAIALGKQLGAGSVVVGSIVPRGRSVQLDLKLVSTTGDSEPLARVSVTGSPDSISVLADSITWSLLRQVWRRGDPPSPSYANLTTRSVPSLRAFLDGEQLSAAGRWSEAADAYAAAIKADSSFWLAGWRYDGTQAWLTHAEPNPDLERGYLAHRSSLGERDRLLIEAEQTGDSVSAAEHLARFRAVTERFPEDWSAWFDYADHLFHQGPLFGRTNAEARAALQRAVDLNPKLVPMWRHLFWASVGHDSAQSGRALRALSGLSAWSEESRRAGFEALLYRTLQSANGQVPGLLIDSLVSAIVAAKRPGPPPFLLVSGFPAEQVDFNQRWLRLAPAGVSFGQAWRGSAWAWAARGAWDSALVALDRYAAASPEAASPVEVYQLAVVGAWLGALDTARATSRRAAAVNYLDHLAPEDSAASRRGRATLAWADGMLAVRRHDPRGVAASRVAVRQSGADGAGFLDRSLAGFETGLRGEKRQAADSLSALDLAATEAELFSTRDPYARSIDHLSASQLLLQLGDTSRAVKLLHWHEADLPPGDKLVFQLFAALAYQELARIEEAQGRTELARDHYQQFLRRYDMPMAAHQRLVDDARAAMRRLAGLNDPPPAK